MHKLLLQEMPEAFTLHRLDAQALFRHSALATIRKYPGFCPDSNGMEQIEVIGKVSGTIRHSQYVRTLYITCIP